jgi:hypothetical protein
VMASEKTMLPSTPSGTMKSIARKDAVEPGERGDGSSGGTSAVVPAMRGAPNVRAIRETGSSITRA